MRKKIKYLNWIGLFALTSVTVLTVSSCATSNNLPLEQKVNLDDEVKYLDNKVWQYNKDISPSDLNNAKNNLTSLLTNFEPKDYFTYTTENVNGNWEQYAAGENDTLYISFLISVTDNQTQEHKETQSINLTFNIPQIPIDNEIKTLNDTSWSPKQTISLTEFYENQNTLTNLLDNFSPKDLFIYQTESTITNWDSFSKSENSQNLLDVEFSITVKAKKDSSYSSKTKTFNVSFNISEAETLNQYINLLNEKTFTSKEDITLEEFKNSKDNLTLLLNNFDQQDSYEYTTSIASNNWDEYWSGTVNNLDLSFSILVKDTKSNLSRKTKEFNVAFSIEEITSFYEEFNRVNNNENNWSVKSNISINDLKNSENNLTNLIENFNPNSNFNYSTTIKTNNWDKYSKEENNKLDIEFSIRISNNNINLSKETTRDFKISIDIADLNEVKTNIDAAIANLNDSFEQKISNLKFNQSEINEWNVDTIKNYFSEHLDATIQDNYNVTFIDWVKDETNNKIKFKIKLDSKDSIFSLSRETKLFEFSYSIIGIEAPGTPSERTPFSYTPHLKDQLPVIKISTEDNSNSFATERKDIYFDSGFVKQEFPYQNCTVSVQEDLNNNNNNTKSEELTGKIKVRGNTTTLYDKKPFKIKFNQKQNLLGLNNGFASKDWVLLANWRDVSMMRNNIGLYLGQYLYKDYNNYASDFINVELYLNDQYWGIYLLCEQNEVASERVNITKPEDSYDGTDIGYLLELDDYSNFEDPLNQMLISYEEFNDYYSSIEPPRRTYTIQSKIYNEKQRRFIEKYLENLYNICNRAINKNECWEFNDDKTDIVESKTITDPNEALKNVLDIDSAVGAIILQELACNYDSSNSSFYMSIDVNPTYGDSKLHFQAPWDFDTAFGIVTLFNGNSTEPEGSFIDNKVSWNPWLILLSSSSLIQTKIKERWNEMKEHGVLEKLLQYLDDTSTKYSSNFKQNYDKWKNIAPHIKQEIDKLGDENDPNITLNWYHLYSYYGVSENANWGCTTQKQASDYLKEWLKWRFDILDNMWAISPHQFNIF